MNVTKSYQKNKKTRKSTKRKQNASMRSLSLLIMATIFILAVLVTSKVSAVLEDGDVYAASEKNTLEKATEMIASLPTGIAGVITGISEAPKEGEKLKRIGTSCENVMVGQRIKTVEKRSASINVSDEMESAINGLDLKAEQMAATPKMMSDGDYDTLLRIVEAEAGTEDIKGRVLVANVIMNRVKNEEFPNTITDVVWEYNNGVPQFSPTYDGSIHTVTVSEETKEAVKQAMEGVDYSEGALFFIQKSAAEKHNIEWFDRDLERLFKHGCHEFYKYPDEEKESKDSENTDSDKMKNKKEKNSDQLLQVVKK